MQLNLRLGIQCHAFSSLIWKQKREKERVISAIRTQRSLVKAQP